jgi:hypothetical protein
VITAVNVGHKVHFVDKQGNTVVKVAYRFGIEYTEAVKLNSVLKNKNTQCERNVILRSEFENKLKPYSGQNKRKRACDN